MVISAVLGAAIGMVLMFAITAMLCSGVTETASNLIQMRSRYLLTGLRTMLDKPESDAGSAAAVKKDEIAKKQLHKQVLTPGTTKQAADAVNARVAGSSADLIGDSPFTTALFDNPLVKSLRSRKVLTGQLRNPQYISSTTFTRALIDMLLPNAIDPAGQTSAKGSVLAELYQATLKLPDGSLKRSLQAFITQSEGDLAKFESSLEDWYDSQMARVSGWYKRWSRVVLGVVGLVIAILINIDTFQVAHALYVEAPLRQAVVSAADTGTLCQGEATADARATCAAQELNQLQMSGLPLGYPSGCRPISGHLEPCWKWSPQSHSHGWDFPLKLLGWIVTAFAVSFGAPFWFDALSKFGSLRNAGAKPVSA